MERGWWCTLLKEVVDVPFPASVQGQAAWGLVQSSPVKDVAVHGRVLKFNSL